MVTQDSRSNDMVSFRAGALNSRLRSGTMAAGAVAKRDLARYYVLIDDAIKGWRSRTAIDRQAWMLIVGFVWTRDWTVIPEMESFATQFGSYLRSPMAGDYSKAVKSRAMAAIAGITLAETYAIIDAAEADTWVSPDLDAAIAGATSAAS